MKITRANLFEAARNLSKDTGDDYGIKQIHENFALTLGGVGISDVCSSLELYHWINGYRSGLSRPGPALALPKGIADPLNDRERALFIQNFAGEFIRKYAALLSVIPEDMRREHNHTPAKIALNFAAEEFMPFRAGATEKEIATWKAMIP